MTKDTKKQLEELVVLHLKNGVVLKGTLIYFDINDCYLKIRLADISDLDDFEQIKLHDLKAIYYVKNLAGDSFYNEKKTFQNGEKEGKRYLVRFVDGEILCGYVRGENSVGILTDKDRSSEPGFFLFPADLHANNKKIFIINTSVTDIREI